MKKSGYSVLNFGYCGDDSRGVLAEVRYILNKSKPRAFLFYFEHNDFSNASRDLLHRKNSFISSEWLLRKIFFFLSPGMKFQLDHIERNVIEAMIVKSFRMLNSELFSTSEYARYSDRIKQKLIANVIEIAELCRKNKVKAIFISPLGNLLYPPVAADENVYKLYLEGIEKKDIGALMKAADNDYFGYDQRGKLNFSDIFKQDSSEYLLIVNLPKSAYQKDLQFFKESFSDIFHFSKKGHAWVFSELVKEGVPEFISN